MLLNRLILCTKSTDEDNDLLKALKESGYTVRQAMDINAALELSKDNDLIYIVADSYPEQDLELTNEQILLSQRKRVRIIAEYPKKIGEKVYGDPYVTNYERMVIMDENETGLKPMTIMTINGCRLLKSEVKPEVFCVAKVAGYDSAVFGLPETVYPLVEKDVDGTGVTVLTTSITRFIRAKYGPSAKWKALWSHLLTEWTGSPVSLDWKPVVQPTYQLNDELPDDAEMQAFRKSYQWFRKYIVVEDKERDRLLAQEGYLSYIDHNGKQEIRVCFRSDCFAETAMVLALHYKLTRNEKDKELANRLLDTIWFTDEYYNNDPKTEYYGLNNWFEQNKNFFGDDNARALLASLLARSTMDNTKWDKPLLRCLLANLRTSSHKTGFRPERIDAEENGPLFKEGKTWRDHYESDVTHYAAHFQAYLWACFLLAYKATGEIRFLESAELGIRNMMAGYPEKWHWTNSMTAEIARMLLPLAFLVRLDDKPEHREWLRFMCNEALSHMMPCGAFRDYIGIVANGAYPPPQSNNAFGTNEASLIQNNGDPATDLLYATNWAFLGFHEAAAAFRQIHEPADDIEKAATNIAQFLCRIQLKKNNEDNDYLDGAWMRSFDFDKWEYWGSSADAGWGAWCVESGWINTWISSVMVLRSRGTTLYDSITDGDFGKLIGNLSEEMLETKA